MLIKFCHYFRHPIRGGLFLLLPWSMKGGLLMNEVYFTQSVAQAVDAALSSAQERYGLRGFIRKVIPEEIDEGRREVEVRLELEGKVHYFQVRLQKEENQWLVKEVKERMMKQGLKKEVTEQEIRKVVKEYIERMFKLFRTCKGVTTDEQIDCPKCGKYRGIALDRGAWRCLWLDCRYAFPKELTPPTPQQLEKFYRQKESEEKNQWLVKFFEVEEIITKMTAMGALEAREIVEQVKEKESDKRLEEDGKRKQKTIEYAERRFSSVSEGILKEIRQAALNGRSEVGLGIVVKSNDDNASGKELLAQKVIKVLEELGYKIEPEVEEKLPDGPVNEYTCNIVVKRWTIKW